MNKREIDTALWTEVGEDVKPWIDSKRYDHACSYMINRRILHSIFNMFNTLDKPFDEIMHDEETLGHMVVNRGIYDGLLMACEMWPMNADIKEILSLPALDGKRLDEWFHSVSTDLKAFSCWAVWQGADGATVRKYCAKHAIKELNDIKKMSSAGDLIFISILFRALVALQILMDKVITPQFNTLVSERMEREKAEWMATHTVFIEPEKPKDDGIRINSFADAFATAKKGKKHATK